MKAGKRDSCSAPITQTRWAAYALAGVATALTGSHTAEGAIHYSGVLTCYSIFRDTAMKVLIR